MQVWEDFFNFEVKVTQVSKSPKGQGQILWPKCYEIKQFVTDKTFQRDYNGANSVTMIMTVTQLNNYMYKNNWVTHKNINT